MKGARKGVMKEGATREGGITPGDASDGRVSGLVFSLIAISNQRRGTQEKTERKVFGFPCASV